MNKQIEENRSCCNSCIHRFVCFQCDDDTLVCSQYKDERDYRKAIDVAREIFAEIDKEYGENCGAYRIDDLTYGQLWDFLAELRKKYESEVADDETDT